MSVARGSAVTLAGQWLKYAVQLLGLVILSRLLDPAEVGVFALVAAVAGVATVIADSGLSLAAVQARSLNDGSRSNLWWINLGVGMFCAFVLGLMAPTLATAFNEPEILFLLPLLSISFVLNGAAIQFRVEINREVQFGRLASIDVISQSLGFAAAVVLAATGFGATSLVVQQIVIAAINLAISIGMTKWRPGLPRPGVGSLPVVRLGASTAATQILNYVSANAATMVLGIASSAQVVGSWNRATQILSLPLQQLVTPITRVVLPSLSRADAAEAGRLLKRFGTALAYVVVGGLLLVVVSADAVVEIVLGPGWEMVGSLLRVLGVGAVFQAIGYPYYWAALARARMNALLLAELPGRILMIVGVLAAGTLGPVWVAIAFSSGLVVVWVGSTIVIPRIVGIPTKVFIQPLWRPVAVWVVVSAVAAVAQSALPDAGPFIDFAIVAALFAVGGLASLSIAGVRRDVRALVDTARTAFGTRGKVGSR